MSYLFHLQIGKTKLPIKQKQPLEYLGLEGGNGHRRNGKKERIQFHKRTLLSALWFHFYWIGCAHQGVMFLIFPGPSYRIPVDTQNFTERKTAWLVSSGSLPSPVDRRCLQGALENTNTNEKTTVWKWEWKIPKFLTVQHAAFQQLLWKLLKTSTSRAAPSTLLNKRTQILRPRRWLSQPAANTTTATQGMRGKLFGIFIIVNYGDKNAERTQHLLPQENCIWPGSLL